MKDNLGLQQYATANDVMEKLVEDYDLASYPLSWPVSYTHLVWWTVTTAGN